jgi:hypothetical protein
MAIYILRAAPLPWGDYGRVLAHGLSKRLARVNGTMQLERAGPFVPPTTLPSISEVVVTTAFREALDVSGLSGLSYEGIDIVTAVPVRWEEWDRTLSRPPALPASGEPEDYLRHQEHDAKCAKEMGPLWEAHAPVWGIGNRTSLGFRKYSYNVDLRASHPDFFRIDGLGFMFVSEGARGWLTESAAGGWLAFEAITYN